MFTYANSEYAAYGIVRKSHEGAEVKVLKSLLKEAGFQPKPSVLATGLMGELVLFFVNLLGDAQVRFEREIDRMREASYGVADSEAGFYKLVDYYVMSILLDISKWYESVQYLQIEQFISRVDNMSTKALTKLMIRKLSYSSPRMEDVLEARACAYILDAIQRNSEIAVDILTPGRFEELFGVDGTFHLVRDDVYPDLSVEPNESEIGEYVSRMEDVIQEKAPFIGQTFDSKRGRHTATVLESSKSGLMKLCKTYSDGTKEVVEMTYDSFLSKYVA